MRIRTLIHFLGGGRGAILTVAADRRALPLGLLFVLSAGFAREYDGEDLVHEPWHLLIPLGASLASSLLLFNLAYAKIGLGKEPRPSFLAAYGSFLGLFWMTAPLAWLYAIPYERFLPAAAAVEANLWTLALVAAWRVALMVRVLVVLFGYPLWAALALVLAFADGLAVLAISSIPLPIVSFMGGVRLSDSERVIRNVSCMIYFWGGCSLPFWVIGTATSLVMAKPSWKALPAEERAPPGRGLWYVAGAALGVWVFILPWTQREQQLRHEVEVAMKRNDLVGALEKLSAHQPDDYPPLWDPPPRMGYAEETPRLIDILEEVERHPPALWVRAVYVEKFERLLEMGYNHPQGNLSPEEVAAWLDRLPEGPAILARRRSDTNGMFGLPLPPEKKHVEATK